MPHLLKMLIACVFALLIAAQEAPAQGAQIAFGGLTQDTSLPVEIEADQLSVDQATGIATFTGNVLIGQGEMRLSAGKVIVEYAAASADEAGKIARLLASGGVTMVNGGEAAEAQNAEYTIDSGKIIMTGNVILTQGQSALSAGRLIVDLKSGTGVMDGRVKSILKTGGN
ncbi:MAG: LptA/OstA family protein [Paracoccaceae bacterium]